MSFPAACFLITLGTDVAYARSYDMIWETFSVWLLAIGLLAAALFVLVGLIQGLVQHVWPSTAAGVGHAAVLVLSIFNVFVHSRDGYTSVVPTGLALSIIVVAILLITGFAEMTSSRRGVLA